MQHQQQQLALASAASASTATPLHRQILEESRQIVSRLKSLIGVVDSSCGQKNGDGDNLVYVMIQFDETMSSLSNKKLALPIVRMKTSNSGFYRDIEQPVVLLAGSVNSGGTKQKRGRSRKALCGSASEDLKSSNADFSKDDDEDDSGGEIEATVGGFKVLILLFSWGEEEDTEAIVGAWERTMGWGFTEIRVGY
ncbi:hypothetical protein LINGRAHAP2_LOCUS23631 [Linum grandiflorum]